MIAIEKLKYINKSKLVSLIFAFCLYILIFKAMPYGPGLSPDSVGYLKAAYGLLNGKGIEYFTSQWPPLYPLIIAIVSKVLNIDILKGAQIIQSVLYSMIFLSLVLLITKTTKINKYFAIILSFIVCLQGTITYIQYYAWSESLFILLVLINAFVLLKHIESKEASLDLYFSLLIVSTLLCYTRYIGYSFALSNAILLLLLTKDNIIKKIIKALFQIFIPICCVIPWLNYRSSFEDANTSATFIYQGFNIEKFKIAFANIGRWVIPNNIGTDKDGGGLVFQIGGVVVLGFILIITIINIYKIIIGYTKKIEVRSRDLYLLMLSITILTYLASFTFFILFLTANINFENRYLVVIYIPTLLIIFISIEKIKNQIIKYVFTIILIICLSISFPETKQRMLVSYHNGIELNSNFQRQKQIYKYINNCSNDLNVIADFPWHFDLFFSNKVSWLPREIYYGSNNKNMKFKSEIEELKEKYDLIIIEDPTNNAIPIIDTNFFNLVFDKNGKIWTNSKLINHGCGEDKTIN